MFLRCLLSFILLLGLVPGIHQAAAQPDSAQTQGVGASASDFLFTFTTVDGPSLIRSVDLQQDNQGQLHLAYGGDHLYYALKNGSNWTTTTLDTGRGAGQALSLALDAQQQPAILYLGALGKQIFMIRRVGDQWGKQAVSPLSAGNNFRSLKLVADAAGRLHASWFSIEDGVVYAAQINGEWVVEVVDPLPRPMKWQVPWQVELAVSPDGTPTLAYGWGSTTYLMVKQAQGWSPETVTPDAMNIALSIDSAGTTHMAYQSGGVFYRSRPAGGTWSAPTPVSDSTGIMVLEMKLDGLNRPQLLYETRISEQGALEWASWNGSGWTHEQTADQVPPVESGAMAAQGEPAAAWLAGGQMKVSRRSDAGWQEETVLQSSTVGNQSSLALNTAGHPRVAYIEDGTNLLKYAAFNGQGYQTEAVEVLNDRHAGTSLRVDSSDRAHLSYFDTGLLKYAVQEAGGWTITPLNEDGRYTTLVLDGEEHPHIAYCGSQGLKLASWDGSEWKYQLVDPDLAGACFNGDAGGEIGFAIAPDEAKHLAYSRRNPNELRYAVSTPTGWAVETVQTEAFSLFVTLQLDSQGHPAISAGLSSAESGNQLLFTERNAGQWLKQIVVSSPTENRAFVYDTSLAFGPDGQPLMPFWQLGETVDTMYLAWREPNGAWRTQPVIEGVFSPMGRTSLVVDGSGQLILAYMDAVTGDMMVARGARPTFVYLPALMK